MQTQLGRSDNVFVLSSPTIQQLGKRDASRTPMAPRAHRNVCAVFRRNEIYAENILLPTLEETEKHRSPLRPRPSSAISAPILDFPASISVVSHDESCPSMAFLDEDSFSISDDENTQELFGESLILASSDEEELSWACPLPKSASAAAPSAPVKLRPRPLSRYDFDDAMKDFLY